VIAARVVRRAVGILLFVVVTVALASPAWAQSARWEVGVGGTFNGAADAGALDATLIDPSGGPLTLYRTTNRLGSGWGVEGLISRSLTEKLRLELAIGWSKTSFETEISGDFENVPGLTASQQAHQFTGDLGLAYRVVQRGRVGVFLRAAGGGFREITDDRSLVENGWRASVGGETLIRLRRASSGWLGGLALRADVRMQARGKGIAFGDSATRLSPVVFAGLVIGQ
jgi:hypothetical protein